jgi:hypothetical protein
MMKVFYLALTLIVLSAASMNAQVTIGSLDNPHLGAVLDLSKATGTTGLGFLLPRFNLDMNQLSEWQLDGTKTDGLGMMIYNTNNTGEGSGVYIWNGSQWSPVKSTISAENKVVEFDFTVDGVNNPSTLNLYIGGSKTFTITAWSPENPTYQGVTWSIISGADKVSITSRSMTSCTVKGVVEGIDARLEIKSLDGNTTKYVDITVSPVTLASFDLPSSLALKTAGTDKSKQLTASNFKGTDGNTISDITVTWSVVAGTTTGSVSPESGINTTTVSAGTTAGTFKVLATAGNLPAKECEITVVQLTGDAPNSTYNPGMTGTWCIDVRDGQAEPGSKDFTVSAGSTVAIKNVDWEIIEPKTGLVTSVPNPSGTNNITQNLVFNSRANLYDLAYDVQTIFVNAYVTYSDNKVIKLEKKLKIHRASCC